MIQKLFDGAIVISRMKEARFVLVYEWLIQARYGKPSPQQMDLISDHLRAIRVATTKLGSDASDEDKRNFRRIELEHMEEIKLIHEGYWYSIQIQSD